MVIAPETIAEAAARLGSRVRSTPVIEIEPGAFATHTSITLKLELMQHTGSFKPRGAFNRMLANAIPAAGVIAASGGNHGAAVAYAARELGHRAEIYVPETTPPFKLRRLEQYGAQVVVTGASYAHALAASEQRAKHSGALTVHAYDQPEVVAGQGTLARELERQAPELDTVFVAVGGGGLIGGVAAWYAGRTRVIGVEPQSCPTLARALEAGRPVDVDVGGIAADSLGARRIGDIAFAVAQHYVERIVLVSDEEILAAQRLLWDRLRVLAEPGGATALAGLLSGRYAKPNFDAKAQSTQKTQETQKEIDSLPISSRGVELTQENRVGVIVCGGNVDPGRFASSV